VKQLQQCGHIVGVLFEAQWAVNVFGMAVGL
jgi:hypothetical protein